MTILEDSDGVIEYIIHRKKPIFFGLFYTWQLVVDSCNINIVINFLKNDLYRKYS